MCPNLTNHKEGDNTMLLKKSRPISWGTLAVGIYYGLTMKGPQEAYVLNTWSLARGANVSCGRNFRRWGLAGGSRSLGASL
jgi:hypothetical protein